MVEDGLWLSRNHRPLFHRPRLRRECYGELIQIDGSDHRWFEHRDAPCTLFVAVDDTTGAIQEKGQPIRHPGKDKLDLDHGTHIFNIECVSSCTRVPLEIYL